MSIERSPHLDGLSEELRAGERAVDDVEVHGEREDQDEERREREVGEERPARRRLAEDLLDARGEGPHRDLSSSSPSASPVRARGPTKTSSRLERTGESSCELAAARRAGGRRARSGARRRAPSGRSGR